MKFEKIKIPKVWNFGLLKFIDNNLYYEITNFGTYCMVNFSLRNPYDWFSHSFNNQITDIINEEQFFTLFDNDNHDVNEDFLTENINALNKLNRDEDWDGALEILEEDALYNITNGKIEKNFWSTKIIHGPPDLMEINRFLQPWFDWISGKNKNIVKKDKILLMIEDDDWSMRCEAAEDPSAVQYLEYKKLFFDKVSTVRRSIVNNPEAMKLEEYKLLFTDSSRGIRKELARSLKATEFDEYKVLFKDDDFHIRCDVVKNHAAMNLDEYRIFFLIKT